MHEVLVNRLGGLSLPRKNVVRLTDRPDMTLDVYRGRKTTMQQQQNQFTVYGMYDFTVLILIKSPVLKDTPASFPTNINLHEFLLASLDWVAH